MGYIFARSEPRVFANPACKSSFQQGWMDYDHGLDPRPDTHPLGLHDGRTPERREAYLDGYRAAWDRHVPDNALFGALPFQRVPEGPKDVTSVEHIWAHVQAWKAQHPRP